MTLDLSFPRRWYVDAYLGDDWQPLIDDVRQKPGIKITRGRANEQAEAVPSKCTFVLDDGPDHGDGSYSPRNPNGQWFGQLGNNTPVRVGLEVGKDAFTRTEADGWGTSPQNGDWTENGVNTFATSVSGGQGIHSITSTGSWCMNYLGTIDVRDVDVSVSVTIDGVSDVTGGDLEPANILMHAQSTASFYLVRMVVTSGEVVQLRLMSNDSSTLEGPVSLGTAYSGQQWRIRANMEQGHLMAKAWPAADAEPLDWQIDTIIEDFSKGAGFIGIRSGVASGNTNTKPVQFKYDDLEIRLPRFAGEMTGMKPSSNLPHTERNVSVECAGILRRIFRYQKNLQSPVQRYILTDPDVNAEQYWPLEDNPIDTTLGRNLLGGPGVRFVRLSGAGAVKWGNSDNIPPSIVAAPDITSSGRLVFPVPSSSTNSTGYCISWGQRISAEATGNLYFRMAGSDDFEIRFYSTGSVEVYVGGVIESTGSLDSMNLGYDNVWHSCTLDLVADGSTTDWFLYMDNVGIGGNAAQALSPLREIEFRTGSSAAASSSYSHVVVRSAPLDSFQELDFFEAFFGRGSFNPPANWDGEDYITRFIRLCTEEGIRYTYVGAELFSPGFTSVNRVFMGPQTPNTTGNLLKECAAVGAATLYEARSLPAVAIRRPYTVHNQAATVTLDYSAGHIAPGFEPVEDDLDPVNDVTAKSAYGNSEARFEKTTGVRNVDDPGTAAGAIGRYDATVTVNADKDSQLLPIAEWLVHLGTVDEPRYPGLTVDLSASAITDALATSLLDVNIDDAITIENLADTMIFEDVRQIARGYTEVSDTQYRHLITYNLSPASPYDVLELDSGQALGSHETTLNEDLDTTETAVTVAVEDDGALWDDANAPFDIMVNGERMTVSAVSGSSSPQTFTVTRSVNGVVREHTEVISATLCESAVFVMGEYECGLDDAADLGGAGGDVVQRAPAAGQDGEPALSQAA